MKRMKEIKRKSSPFFTTIDARVGEPAVAKKRGSKNMVKHFLFCLCTLIFTSPALACPVCDSDTGKAVRAGVFGGDFGFNLLVTVIPFVVCLGITAVIYYGFPAWGGRPQIPSGQDPYKEKREKAWR